MARNISHGITLEKQVRPAASSLHVTRTQLQGDIASRGIGALSSGSRNVAVALGVVSKAPKVASSSSSSFGGAAGRIARKRKGNSKGMLAAALSASSRSKKTKRQDSSMMMTMTNDEPQAVVARNSGAIRDRVQQRRDNTARRAEQAAEARRARKIEAEEEKKRQLAQRLREKGVLRIMHENVPDANDPNAKRKSQAAVQRKLQKTNPAKT